MLSSLVIITIFFKYFQIANKEVLRPQQTAFQGKNTSLEIKNDLLENDIAFLKGRVRDLESRQTKMLSSSANKVQHILQIVFNTLSLMYHIRDETVLQNSRAISDKIMLKLQ